MSFQTSEKGRAFIIAQEGLELVAYRDIVGVWTIGVGDTKDVYPGLVITKAQAEERFARRLAEDFEPIVNDAIAGVPTTQAQFDAMVSLAYNIGVGYDPVHPPRNFRKHGFRQSTVLRLHREKNYKGAAQAFLMWVKAGGREVPALRRRRLEESDIYMSNLPGSVSIPQEQNVVELIKQVQRILGIVDDGDPGPITRDAVQRWKEVHGNG